MVEQAARGAFPSFPVGRGVGVGIILVVALGLFSVSEPGFLTRANLVNIGLQSAILLLLALPMTLIILSEGLDLSMGAMMSLTSMVIALTSAAGYPVLLALGAGLATALAGGLLNGGLVALFDLPPFVATLGTLGMAQGLALVLTDGESVVNIAPSIPAFFGGFALGVPYPILVAAAAYAGTYGLLYRTRFGTAVFALGGNRQAWTLAGGNVRLCLVMLYAFAGLMVGVASFLFTGRMTAGHPTASLGMEFDAIAAVALGGTAFERANGWLSGTVLGVLVLGVVRNGLNLMGLPSSAQLVCEGLLLLLALFINGIATRR